MDRNSKAYKLANYYLWKVGASPDAPVTTSSKKARIEKPIVNFSDETERKYPPSGDIVVMLTTIWTDDRQLREGGEEVVRRISALFPFVDLSSLSPEVLNSICHFLRTELSVHQHAVQYHHSQYRYTYKQYSLADELRKTKERAIRQSQDPMQAGPAVAADPVPTYEFPAAELDLS